MYIAVFDPLVRLMIRRQASESLSFAFRDTTTVATSQKKHWLWTNHSSGFSFLQFVGFRWVRTNATVRFGFLSNLMQSLRINPGVVDQTSVHSIDIVIFTHGTTSHMRTMALVYKNLQLTGGFWTRANVGKYSSTMEHILTTCCANEAPQVVGPYGNLLGEPVPFAITRRNTKKTGSFICPYVFLHHSVWHWRVNWNSLRNCHFISTKWFDLAALVQVRARFG